MDTSSISFTALYTGHVWYAHQMSEPFFTTPASHALYWAMQPVEKLAQLTVGVNVAETLLQRHAIIDHRLGQLIRDQGVTQILEIACGLSPRGFRFTAKYPSLTYIEGDLPDMVARKRAMLSAHTMLGQRHDVVACNFFESGTPSALDTVLATRFDATKPIVVVTEGLVNYFDTGTISEVWSQLARLLRGFPSAWYITDLYPQFPGRLAPLGKAASALLGLASQADVTLHFRDDAEITHGFSRTGFRKVTVHSPEQFYDTLPLPRSRRRPLIRVIECRV